MSVVKRVKTDGPAAGQLAKLNGGASAVNSAVQLSGHHGEVLAVSFDPQGEILASGGADKSIYLWNGTSNFANIDILNGHKGAVLDLVWSRDSRGLYSCSSDHTVATWDTETSRRTRKHVGHEAIVNSIDTVKRGTELIVSGSDDGSIGIWDPREKEAVDCIETQYPILAVAASHNGSVYFSSGIDSAIYAWDARKTGEALYKLPGHNTETVTSLQVSPDGTKLLSFGMDNWVRLWDVQPFASGSRALTQFDGARHGLDQNLLKARWTPRGDRIAAGSSEDNTVIVWDAYSRQILHKLAGHRGSPNAIALTDSLIASGSSDKTIIVGPH
ncbi:hypothetical protein TRVA0_007S03554 [Trichomonascus vanleenenianus]|uniref:WD40 repeat domain-containing protein n=1 Tax=Trichomonascus vanleenenianus TaxID=2268995 RepID=UPI003ECACD87